MKKFNLSKELLLNGMLIGVLSIGLASCGGGGGGGSSLSTSLPFGGSGPSTPTSPGSSSSSTPTSPGSSSSSTVISFSTNLYAGTDYPNEPIVTVYIDGQPVKLVADTGESGVVVNSSAVNIPSSDIYSSYTIYDIDGIPAGTIASATVCLNPSITNSCVVMPIGLISATGGDMLPNGTYFASTREAQGYFGLSSGIGLNSSVIAYNDLSGSSTTGLSYPTYLEWQYGINSYTISFYPLSNGYYSDVSGTVPIGQISFGVYNGNSNTLISYTVDPDISQIVATAIFPSGTASPTSFTGYVTFHTDISQNILNTEALETEIPYFSFSQYEDEGACANYYGFPSNIVNSGFVISYILQNNDGSFQTESFTTEPSLSFCQAGIPFTLMEGITYGYGYIGTVETFGLSAMLGHTFTWVLGTSGTNRGFVQDIGISP